MKIGEVVHYVAIGQTFCQAAIVSDSRSEPGILTLTVIGPTGITFHPEVVTDIRLGDGGFARTGNTWHNREDCPS